MASLMRSRIQLAYLLSLHANALSLFHELTADPQTATQDAAQTLGIHSVFFAQVVTGAHDN